MLGFGGSGPRISSLATKRHKKHKSGNSLLCAFCAFSRLHFLNRFANAWRASVGAPDEVCRSTTVRGTNSSQVLRAFLLTMRAGIDLLHWKCALGSKYVHWRQV